MALAVPRIRLRLPVPVASRGPDPCAWRLRMRNGDTMNDFAANDLETADLLALALARLDDDGAPPAVTPATGQAAAPRGQPGSGPTP